jgi:hypothetical protein
MEEEEENEDPHGHITSLAVFRRFYFFITQLQSHRQLVFQFFFLNFF